MGDGERMGKSVRRGGEKRKSGKNIYKQMRSERTWVKEEIDGVHT